MAKLCEHCHTRPVFSHKACRFCQHKRTDPKWLAKKEKNKNNAVKKKVGVKEKDGELEKWFLAVRKKLTGVCQCGCGKPSCKNDDTYYKFSCCHLFPKNRFGSVATHPNNYVERAFWGGCHSRLDDFGMDRWKEMADWPEIVEKFHELAPLLTEEERTNKFYIQFEELVYSK